MPELPDLTVYVEALAQRLVGQRLLALRLLKPFVLRTVTPAPEDFLEQSVSGIERVGKRIVLAFANQTFAVIHLMIAGRLHWFTVPGPPNTRPKTGATTPVDSRFTVPGPPNTRPKTGAATPDILRKPPAHALVRFDFGNGQLLLTEAGSKRRASLHLLPDRATLQAADPGGLEVQGLPLAAFAERLRLAPHTLKRALTDPAVFAGIGNSYSDEILHAARLSPLQLTRNLDEAEVARLHGATQQILSTWIRRLRDAAGAEFPNKVTAFHPAMAVHGRYRLPCPDCGAPVQRIVHAEHEFNYCARCQTGGKVLADRVLSRLLHDSFPRTLDG